MLKQLGEDLVTKLAEKKYEKRIKKMLKQLREDLLTSFKMLMLNLLRARSYHKDPICTIHELLCLEGGDTFAVECESKQKKKK